MAALMTLTDPRHRLVMSESYTPDVVYAIGQALWVLSGSDDLDAIAFYNSKGRAFTDDGKTVPSAPGPRIFGLSTGSQMAAIVSRLTRDPLTRRAMLQIYLPDDTLEESRDICCTGSMQFLLRRSKLECVATMRSQAAARVLPYDLFLLTMLQEWIACELGVEIGSYHHFCGSLHIYEDELDIAKKIVAEPHQSTQTMPPMTSAGESVRRTLANAERDIRMRLLADPDETIVCRQYGLDPYWTGLLQVIVSGVRRRLTGVETTDPVAEVPSQLRKLLDSN